MSAILSVDFGKTSRIWEGFGVQYVEMMCDLEGNYEDYSSFSETPVHLKEYILDKIFGEDGLGVGIQRMFLSPYLMLEPPEPGAIKLDDYRFNEVMPQIIGFAREAIRRSREMGIEMKFLATMHGPPIWGNKQKICRGKDLDPTMRDQLATYLAGVALYLRVREGINVVAVSPHNEGEDPNRYPGKPYDDYNMYWTPEEVADFIPRVRQQLDAVDLTDVAVDTGEYTNWEVGIPYTEEFLKHPETVEALGIVTSHAFSEDHDPTVINAWRAEKPQLHAWTTSCSWQDAPGLNFARGFIKQINSLGHNALLPWCMIQNPPKWPGTDPNPYAPFHFQLDGSLKVHKAFYYYKQLTRAGRPGKRVASVSGGTDDVYLTAFSSTDNDSENAIIVLNQSDETQEITINLNGSRTGRFKTYRTDDKAESYTYAGYAIAENEQIVYSAPPHSLSTFFEQL